MKIAKADEADLEMAMELTGALDVLTGWVPIVPPAIEQVGDLEESEHFDRDDAEQCQRVLGYIIDLADKASLMRVVLGCAVMLDPINKLVDPDADTIEHHPERQRLEQQRDELLRALDSLCMVAGRIAFAAGNGAFIANHDWEYLDAELSSSRAAIAKTKGGAA